MLKCFSSWIDQTQGWNRTATIVKIDLYILEAVIKNTEALFKKLASLKVVWLVWNSDRSKVSYCFNSFEKKTSGHQCIHLWPIFPQTIWKAFNYLFQKIRNETYAFQARASLDNETSTSQLVLETNIRLSASACLTYWTNVLFLFNFNSGDDAISVKSNDFRYLLLSQFQFQMPSLLQSTFNLL